MTVFGISMVKDEEDVIEYTIKYMLTQVDHILIADNLSTDSTREILESFGDQITLAVDEEVAYYQGRKMTSLAMRAKGMGADWAVPFDADELWYSPVYSTISEHLKNTSEDVVRANWTHHTATCLDDQIEVNPFKRMTWRRSESSSMFKVAVRILEGLVIEQGNHGANYSGRGYLVSPQKLESRHFPYRTPSQFVNKVRNGLNAYRATTLAPEQGSHWRMYGKRVEEEGEEAMMRAFVEEGIFVGDSQYLNGIDFINDPVLWREP